MTRLRSSIFVAAACILFHSGCGQTPVVSPRPATWAQPVTAAGLPNLHSLSPALYRSATPGPEGYASARTLGIRTVVSLRREAGDLQAADAAGLEVIRIPVRTYAPAYDQVRRFFDVVDDPARTPVLLHCYHGADRTGAFSALYRINRQGWSRRDAIAEMTGGGYHFHRRWILLVPWVRNAPAFDRPATSAR